MVYVRQSVLADAIELAPNLRQADLDELSALRTDDPLFALIAPFTDQNAQTYSIVGDQNEVVGIFGVNEFGAVWMLSSDLLYERYKKEFIRQAKHWIDVLHAPHEFIYNYVDQRNTVSINWLRHCGFTVSKTNQPYGLNDEPFHLLYKSKELSKNVHVESKATASPAPATSATAGANTSSELSGEPTGDKGIRLRKVKTEKGEVSSTDPSDSFVL